MSARSIVGPLLMAGWIALSACENKEAESSEVPAPTPPALVEVMTIEADAGGGDIKASGLIGYGSEAALSFGAPGELEQIRVDIGDQVRRGQNLATLRRTTVGADLNESEIVEQTAQQNYERIRRLHESGAASDADLDSARLALERSRTRVTLSAPTSGVILRRDAERGQVVGAGQPVLWLGEAQSGIIVRAAVTSAEAARLEVGAPVAVKIRDRDELTGEVDRISPVSVGAAGVFEVEIAINDAAGLRTGEVADVSIATPNTDVSSNTTYVIPAMALIDARADQGVVFLVDAEGRAERRSVETGGVNDVGVIVLSGLQAGDNIITRGASMLRNGEAVRVSNR